MCHVSLLDRYKLSAFVYFCLCCGADTFYGILKFGFFITMGMGENSSEICLKLKSRLVLHQNGNGRAVKVQGSSGMRPGIHDYGEMSGHCAPLGKVRTNEMRGQPRNDLGDKQILMTRL